MAKYSFTTAIAVMSVLMALVDACSNIIVSSGASADSSNIISYNADSSGLYGSLYHYPAAIHDDGVMRDVYNWDSGEFMGQIKEAKQTFNVVGNINEKGVIIGETTFGGIESLQSQSGAKIDYGSLIYITLQRASSAREAIKIVGDLMNEYGYASGGESFSIADQKESWVMELIGKGNYEKGAVWVALKVPDGYICAHANQARITTFPLNDPDSCVYAPDTISFAKRIGLYPRTGRDSDFSFSDVYDPVTFSGARACEARVWSVYGAVMGAEWAQRYEDYALGYNLTNRMPLFVKPAAKISVTDTMELMRSHYENTALDMTGLQFSDVGAAYSETPYRAHPLTWSSKVQPDGTTGDKAVGYMHERPIATPQTGWNFVAQSRRWMPTPLSGLLWFGVDDSSTTVHFPVYGSATKVPESFAGKGSQQGVTAPMMTFSMDSAFYVFNLVANWAYTRWDLIYPEVRAEILRRESAFVSQISEVDRAAQVLLEEKGTTAAVQYVTDFSEAAGNALVKDWAAFFGQLFVKFRDGYIVTADPSEKTCGCKAVSASYPQAWFDRIVKDTGAHYAVRNDDLTLGGKRTPALAPISKRDLLARR